MRFVEVAMPATIVAAVGLLLVVETGVFDSSSGPVLIHSDPSIHGSAPARDEAKATSSDDLLVGRSAGMSRTDLGSSVDAEAGAKSRDIDPTGGASMANNGETRPVREADLAASEPTTQDNVGVPPSSAAQQSGSSGSPQPDDLVVQMRARIDDLLGQAQKVHAETEAKDSALGAALVASHQHEAALEQQVSALQKNLTNTEQLRRDLSSAQEHEKLLEVQAAATRAEAVANASTPKPASLDVDRTEQLKAELATARQNEQSLRRQVASLQANVEGMRNAAADARRAPAVQPIPKLRATDDATEHKRLLRELAALKHLQLVGELAALKKEAANGSVRTR